MTSPLRRTILIAPAALFASTALVCALPRLSGIDPAAAVLRARFAESEPDAASLAAVRSELGISGNWLQQYIRFVGRLFSGDLGTSYVSRRPVLPDAWSAFRVSLIVMALGLVCAIALAIPLGILAATRPHGRTDGSITTGSALGSALPEHVVGPLAALVFGVWFDLLPTGGWGDPLDVVLPVAMICLSPASMLTMIVRAEMVEALQSPFIRTARGKGLAEGRVAICHGFAVARRGVVSFGSAIAAGLLGGAVVVEVVFSVPGGGRYLLEAIRNADLPAIQAGLLIALSGSIAVGAVADALGTVFDPRTTRR